MALAASPSPVPVSTPAGELSPQDSQEVQAPPTEKFFTAKVLQILEDKKIDVGGYQQPYQKVKIKILDGSEKDKVLEVEHGNLFAIQEDQKVKQGETIVITKAQGPAGDVYYITDKYRIFPLIILFGIFLGMVVFFGRLKGLSSIGGLLLSAFILIKFVVPQILAGGNPLTISLGGALAIAILSIYMAHGISRRTTIALGSSVITLVIATVLSLLFVAFVSLTGTGSEEAIFLRMGPIGAIDLKGLLLGGIIIGTLGVLDDITITQSATIDEIKKANPKLSSRELFTRGLSVGQEHISSLVNTLALAYVGASFPLLLLFSISRDIPFWLTLNSEFITEEIVRTLVGSMALILAVPISTFLAAYFLQPKVVKVAVAKAKVNKTKTSGRGRRN
jgi:uncharacterized membrane protein